MDDTQELTQETADAVREELEEFSDRVYWLVAQVPVGEVVTYGQIALYAGSPRAARAVGSLMRRSQPQGIDIPWQRVINASGGISFKGDFARAELQRRLLEEEGVLFANNGRCDLEKYRWQPEVLFWDASD